MNQSRDPLAQRARKRLLGTRTIGKSAAEIREAIRYGYGNEDEWPRSQVETNPTARRLVESTRTSDPDEVA